MELNREKLKRMFEDTKGNGGSANSGGGGGSLAGYATQAWVNEGFVSIEFFNRLFTVYGPGETSSDPDVVIEPNDLDSTIKNIKAMFGFWTEYYVSALGNGGDLGSTLYLSSLADVALTSPISDGQVLQYNLSTGKWTNATLSLTTTLGGLTDVTLTTPQDNQVMIYDFQNSKWINSNVKTINGYSIFGTGNIDASGGGTGNYLPLAGGTMTGTITFNKRGYLISASEFNIGQNLDSDFYLYSTKNINFYLYTNGTERLTVTGSGLVGINNTSPSYTLDVTGIIKSEYMLFRSMDGSEAGYVGRGSSVKNDVMFSAYSGNKLELGANGSYQDLVINTSHFIGIGTETPLYKFHVNGASYLGSGALCGNDGNSNQGGIWIGAKYDGDNSSGYDCIERSKVGATLYIQFFNSGNLNLCGGGGNVSLGTSSYSYKLNVSGSIYATGEITALSDIKQKNIKEYMQLGVDEVANAPIIKFTWKDQTSDNKGLHVGSIAQYWEKVLPEAVKRDKEGTLSMSYGVVALVAAISTAKKVQEHERRIADLERENNELKVRLRRLNRYGKQ